MKTLNENEKSQPVTEELDLLKIIALFWNWCIKYIWRPFLEIVRMCIRRWYIFLVAILLGLGLAYYFAQRQVPRFTASVQFKTNPVVNVTTYVNKLKILAKSPSSWKEELKLSDEAAQNIVAIAPHYFVYTNDDYRHFILADKEQYLSDPNHPLVPNWFEVQITTRTPQFLSEYTQAFYDYLINNKLLKDSYEGSIPRFESEAKYLQEELNIFAQWGSKINNRTKDEKGSTPSLDVQSLHQATRTTYLRLIDVTEVLNKKEEPIQIISPFAITGSQMIGTSPSKTKIVGGFFLIALVLTFIVDYRKELAAFSKKHLSK